MPEQLKVWLDGNLINFDDAKVSIMTHSLQYGSGIFEGIRAYEIEGGTAIFRLKDHIRRFKNTAKIYGMDLRYTANQLIDAVKGTVKINNLRSCYIRPFAFYDDTKIGVHTRDKKVSTFISTIPYGAYFGKAKEEGLRCKVSSWHRINSMILPIQAKASGNYINSIIANNEVVAAGYDEAILTSVDGFVAEGPGSNIFLVQDGRLITPNRDSDILLGITRDSILKMAKSLSIEVNERFIHREELYTSEEAFFAGTAAEITPIVSVDNIELGSGKPGPLTSRISDKFSEIVHGKDRFFSEWLTEIPLQS